MFYLSIKSHNFCRFLPRKSVVLDRFHGWRKQVAPPHSFDSIQLGLRTFAVAVAKASDYFGEATHGTEEKDTAEGQTQAYDK